MDAWLVRSSPGTRLCFIQEAQDVSSRFNSTSLKLLWMSLNKSKDNQDFHFHIIYPSVLPSILISLPLIHTIQLLILGQASFPYRSSLHFSVGFFWWYDLLELYFFKIPISAFNYKPITMIVWLMSVFPLLGDYCCFHSIFFPHNILISRIS